ncbi:BTAD domain-containing putative transcriptional regulator [Streptomyces turgidiscabies]|uniref:Tetratricopeptide repeat protein n=1 Tax=Streptomyces turgidiscabies (strain Car8) TaxID=698760 RepID=L7FF54_STRT8|nr:MULTISPECIES: BTAD domain-containing putative transcriptional regulator [Streptomyces]ELP69711.1 tetratricopeptide repeat protein [Streptomyces turgidiscabies Car8]MDX3491398.1 BTAD domain-containing putative transcriptional regulator [Streptomyces turgidiscabies]GAQ73920.1 regulatory protein AfsR [Streptomyces turgidiscabies]
MFEVRLLGPVEVWEGDRRAPLGGVRPLAVLSALVVHLGEVLSTERLVDCVWDERAPATAGALVATHVSAVRRALAQVTPATVVRTRPPGYVADLEPSQVDARRFEDLLASGRTSAADGRPEEAADLLSEALGLWRGPEALEGLAQSFARIEAARLAELRLIAQEESFALRLDLGGADRTIAPLLAHVAANPLRERPRGQLMTALFRTGRVSDALRTYQEGRAILREELGIDPGPQLQSLHQAVLTNDAKLSGDAGPQRTVRERPRLPKPSSDAPRGASGASPRPAPSHLPPDIADFVGRSEQIDWASSLLSKVDETGRTASPIGVLSGRSGTGKTALAVHVGHRMSALFPDGRLFVDLRAGDTAPLQPADALARLLRAMGADPEDLPTSVEELTGLYRTLIGHRRVLLILDNAAGEAHVRPLLPSGPGCAVLVTSRRRLVALEGAAHLDLAVPDEGEALELLRRVAGPDRTDAEPERAAEIVSLCGRLPLAVRIAGARLAARPHWTPGRLAGRLRDQRSRLNELSAGDLELRTSLELGYADLDLSERRALRRLALFDLPDFAAWIAAPLLDIGTLEAEEAVERLVDRHFIDVIGVDDTGRGRYRIHDLAREHAREHCLSEESAEERRAAVLRLVASWLGLARKAAALGPGAAGRYFPEPAAVRALDAETEEELLGRPASWFAAEQACLLAAVEYCADNGMDRAARDLAGALIASSAALYNQFDAWTRSHAAAMAAVHRSGDGEGEAWLLAGLGQLRYEQDEFEESYTYFSKALRLFEARGDVPEGAALALAGMGTARREQAGYAEASDLLNAALGLYGESGERGARARVLYGIGYVHREQGRGAQARQVLAEALELYRAEGDRNGEALTLRSLALCHRAEGRLADAERLLHEALRIFAGLRDTFGVMYTEQSLAKTELRLGRLDEARERLGRCLEIARERQDRFGEALVLRTLGEWHLAAGDPDGAREPLERALSAWQTLRLPLWRARTVRDLAEVWEAQGDSAAARSARAEAHAVFRELGCGTAEPAADAE